MAHKRWMTKRTALFSMAGLIVFFGINTGIVVSVQAETFCVSTSAELDTALTSARANGENDTIQVIQGVYKIGNRARGHCDGGWLHTVAQQYQATLLLSGQEVRH